MDLSFWGSLASIVGLVVSGVTLWAVRQLQTRFRYRASAPLLEAKLDTTRAAVSSYLGNPEEGAAELEEALTRLPQTLRDLSALLPRPQRRHMREVEGRVRARGQDLSRDQLRATFRDLLALNETLENYNEAQRWQS